MKKLCALSVTSFVMSILTYLLLYLVFVAIDYNDRSAFEFCYNLRFTLCIATPIVVVISKYYRNKHRLEHFLNKPFELISLLLIYFGMKISYLLIVGDWAPDDLFSGAIILLFTSYFFPIGKSKNEDLSSDTKKIQESVSPVQKEMSRNTAIIMLLILLVITVLLAVYYNNGY